MKKSIIYRYVGILLFSILFVIPALSQFSQGTTINIDEKGIENDYDFKSQLHLGDLTVDYKQVGKYRIDGNSTVLIACRGGLMQNFEYSLGIITVTEQIIIGDSVIPRKIVYNDGISTITVKVKKYKVKEGVYIDLNSLWLTIRQEKTIPELVNQMKSEDSKLRMEGVKELANYGQPAIPSLVIALKDSNSEIRESAAIAVGKLKDNRAIKPLISLLNDEAWYVRLKVAWALGQIQGTEQIVPLNQALAKEKDDFVRNALTKSLKKLGN